MTVRTVVGLGWALLTGLGGAWLAAAPWVLGQQPSGVAWTTVTSAQLGTGLGLVVLALMGAALVVAQVSGSLREAEALRRPASTPEPAAPALSPWSQPHPVPGTGGGTQDQEALISLAQALADELTEHELAERRRQEEGQPSGAWRGDR
jgi:hypothetical protein